MGGIMTLLGIDLSMQSPALCLFEGDNFCFDKCQFYFLTSKEKYLYVHPKLHGELFPDYYEQPERFNNIGTWIVDVCKSKNVDKVFVEDYSYGSVGRIFNIAENGGVCKYLMWKNNIKYETIPPTVIKKFATGKGNSDKQKMQDSFISETNFDIKDVLKMTEKQWNPSSDLIDSYFICKYGEYNERSRLETERQKSTS